MSEVSQPLEQTIIDAVAEWLSCVRRSNGYWTDAGSKVIAEDDLLPAKSDDMVDGFYVVDESMTVNGRTVAMSISVETLVKADPGNTRRNSRKVVADARRAIQVGLASSRIKGVKVIEVTSSETRRREPGAGYLVPAIRLNAEFFE